MQQTAPQVILLHGVFSVQVTLVSSGFDAVRKVGFPLKR